MQVKVHTVFYFTKQPIIQNSILLARCPMHW